jgi:transporter family protein
MRMVLSASWQFWALLSACFAALTAIFAKIGVENVDPDMATLIRTVIIFIMLTMLLYARGQLHSPDGISTKSWIFLILSGAATGASWICYFRALKIGDAARVAPLDKLSLVIVAVFGVLFLGENLSHWNWAGVVLMAAGALLVVYRG